MMDFPVSNENINETTAQLPLEYAWNFLPIVVTVPPLGLPANALVIRHLLGKPGICSTSEIFTLSLALFDMLFCLMVLIEFIRFLFVRTIGSANFLVWGLNQAGGPMLLCLLSLDSYIAVCHPLVFLRLKDPKLRLSVCLVVCVITAACCSLAKNSSGYKWTVISMILSSAIVIISTCNILILKSLRQSGPSRKEVHPVKKRAFRIVLTAFVLVIFHYLPPAILYLLLKFFHSHVKSALTSVTYQVLSTGSFFQPLSYLVRTKQLPRMRCPCASTAKAETVATVKST